MYKDELLEEQRAQRDTMMRSLEQEHRNSSVANFHNNGDIAGPSTSHGGGGGGVSSRNSRYGAEKRESRLSQHGSNGTTTDNSQPRSQDIHINPQERASQFNSNPQPVRNSNGVPSQQSRPSSSVQNSGRTSQVFDNT